MLNLRDFGVGDGADYTSAFTQAQDQFPGGGGALYCPAGLYLLNAPDITKPIRLIGDGPATVLRSLYPSIQQVIRILAAGVSVENLSIEGAQTAAGVTLRGLNVYGKQCVVHSVSFSGLSIGVDLEPWAVDTDVEGCTFKRMVSSSGNGTSVLLEGVSGCRIRNNRIDGANFVNLDNSPGAAIALTQLLNGPGASDNEISSNRINDHPHVGISVGSTTYAEWPGVLGQETDNLISDNTILRCGSTRGGPAGSAISVNGNSHRTQVVRNRIAFMRGHGISVEGALYIDGSPGTPKLNEIPDGTRISENDISNVAEEPIHEVNAANTLRRNNVI